MPSTRDFRRRIEDVQDDLRAEYDVPFCEIAHREFEIPETLLPEEEREEMRAGFAAHGINIAEDSIKLTGEHREFHEALRRLVVGFQMDGADAVQMLSAALAIGRRIGMKDATDAMSSFGGYDTRPSSADDTVGGA